MVTYPGGDVCPHVSAPSRYKRPWILTAVRDGSDAAYDDEGQLSFKREL